MRPGTTREDVLSALNENGIRSFTGSCPEVYLEKVFSDLKVERKPTAIELGKSSLAFEVHPTLDAIKLKSRAAKAAEILAGFQAT